MDAALVFLLCLLVGFLQANDCPHKEDVWPCKCAPARYNKPLNDVECGSIRKPEELLPPMQALRSSKTRVNLLKIANSTLSYIPDNLFQGTHIEQVQFEKTKIIHLSEHRTAFMGLENVLERLDAIDVNFVAGLQLDQLSNLKKLRTIVVHRCRTNSVVPSLPYFSALTRLDITNSGISSIANRAFSDLPNLSDFIMTNNHLTEMRRSMFPNPAERLLSIDLSDNSLSSLPKDFFFNMPKLEKVFLDNNQFMTMDEKPFADVFRIPGLEWFWMHGNRLHCDCKLSWLGRVRFPKYFEAKCATPEAFSGKDVRSLRLQTCHLGLLESLLASKRFPTR